ncbi:MAG TPA: response regulator [Candidatus Limnocylindria bacterium]|nr:response regulator [Candidatus Limnocylindria bacterium]
MNSLLQPGGTPVQPPSSGAPVPGTAVPPKRVLLVDDDAALRWITARFLTEAGYTVDVAEDGEKGWATLRDGKYDLLVTDHNMPHMTGMQLVGRLRFWGLTLPVIVVSAADELGEAGDYPWLKLTAILRKPFELAELVSVARHAVPPGTAATEAEARRMDSSGDHAACAAEAEPVDPTGAGESREAIAAAFQAHPALP